MDLSPESRERRELLREPTREDLSGSRDPAGSDPEAWARSQIEGARTPDTTRRIARGIVEEAQVGPPGPLGPSEGSGIEDTSSISEGPGIGDASPISIRVPVRKSSDTFRSSIPDKEVEAFSRLWLLREELRAFRRSGSRPRIGELVERIHHRDAEARLQLALSKEGRGEPPRARPEVLRGLEVLVFGGSETEDLGAYLLELYSRAASDLGLELPEAGGGTLEWTREGLRGEIETPGGRRSFCWRNTEEEISASEILGGGAIGRLVMLYGSWSVRHRYDSYHLVRGEREPRELPELFASGLDPGRPKEFLSAWAHLEHRLGALGSYPIGCAALEADRRMVVANPPFVWPYFEDVVRRTAGGKIRAIVLVPERLGFPRLVERELEQAGRRVEPTRRWRTFRTFGSRPRQSRDLEIVRYTLA